MKDLPRSKSEKFMVSVQTLQESQKFLWLHTVAVYRGIFRTWLSITMKLFFDKVLNGFFKLLTIFAKKNSITDVRLG